MAKDIVKNETKKPEKETKLNKEKAAKTKESKQATNKKVSKKSESNTKKETKIKSSKSINASSKTSKVSKANSKTSDTVVNSVSSKDNLKTASSQKKATSKASKKSTAKPMLAEYYDLPYRYNQTIVKILAQTPTTLFVYWDIADADRNALISMHGENFFNETRPILVVHNITKNYTFEIEINDFANSWYIRTQEPNSDYVIELGRRYNKNNGEFIYINSSNNIVSPNDHILFENINLGHVLFRNVKTSDNFVKDFGDLKLINDIDKLYGNIYDVYSTLYNDEILNDIANPSSGEFYLKK